MQQSLQPQVQSWNRPSPLVPELAFGKMNGYEALTAPSGCANWADRKRITILSALRPKLNDVLSSSFLTVLCALGIFFLCSVKASHIWLADCKKPSVDTVFVDQSFYNVPSHNITFPGCTKRTACGLYTMRLTTSTSLLPLLTELPLANPLLLSIYTDHWWSHIR